MDAAGWDTRYAADELIWTSEPNRWMVKALANVTVRRVAWVRANLLTYVPTPRSSAAVAVLYVHLLHPARRARPANAAEGVGGPSDPTVLFTAADIVADLAGLAGLEALRAERRRHPASSDARRALDAVVEVVRGA